MLIRLTAMELALSLEKLTNEKLLNLHAVRNTLLFMFSYLCFLFFHNRNEFK